MMADKAKGPLYHPPFRGRKGAEYGARSPSEYQRQIAEHKQSIEGGGLYDKAEESQEAKEAHAQERYDLAEMTAFVESTSTKIGTKLIQVFYLYWRDGKSLTHTARIMLAMRPGTESLGPSQYRTKLKKCKITTKRQINDLRKMLAKRKSPC